MKILILGQGAREHAIALALHQENKNHLLYALPGNPGMKKICQNLKGHWSDFELIKNYICEFHFDLVIIGPESPLALGLADFMISLGVPVFGPDQKCAMLETSKVFSKEFMNEFRIPTAKSIAADSSRSAMELSSLFSLPIVMKQDGLAAGKGVTIHDDFISLELELDKVFSISQDLKSKVDSPVRTGSEVIQKKILLEEFLQGEEISYMILLCGQSWLPLLLAKDYKKKYDNNMGPNTGGMGAVAPEQLSAHDRDRIYVEIIEPTIRGLIEKKLNYCGVLYFGIMLTDVGPKLLEYNVRFGDPEAQAILPLLEQKWSDVFLSMALHKRIPDLTWKNKFSAVVNLTTREYPIETDNFESIDGETNYHQNKTYLLHGATRMADDQKLLTSGGRIFSCVSISDTKQESIEQAYKLVDLVNWPGKHYRKDIGLSNLTSPKFSYRLNSNLDQV